MKSNMEIICYDWREFSIDEYALDELNGALSRVGNVRLFDVSPKGADYFVFVVAPAKTTQRQAQKYYKESEE